MSLVLYAPYQNLFFYINESLDFPLFRYGVAPASIPSGKTIDIQHAYDKYLEEVIGNNKVLLIFLQDEVLLLC